MNDARTLARLAAVQAIYEQDMAGHDLPDNGDVAVQIGRIKELAELSRINKKLCEGILETVSRETNIIQIIRDNLAEGWTAERIGGVLRAVLTAAIAEKKAFPDTPKSVIISEYVNIASSFHDEKEAKFVNGILNKIL